VLSLKGLSDESLRVSSILVDCFAMIAARSTKSGLPRYPAKIDARAKLLGHFDSYSVKSAGDTQC